MSEEAAGVVVGLWVFGAGVMLPALIVLVWLEFWRKS